MIKYPNTQIYKYTDIQIYKYTNIQIYRYTDILMLNLKTIRKGFKALIHIFKLCVGYEVQ